MKQILLVEDEKRIASFIEKGLIKYGFHPTIVDDAQKAIDQVSIKSYDLILLDLSLPTISGWEVLQTLRNRGLTLPIIIVTALVDQENLALESGANDIIEKPFKFSDLLDKIHHNLSTTQPNPDFWVQIRNLN